MNVLSNNNIKSETGINALKEVMDPEIGLNIVDLGLVYELNFDEENKTVNLLMTLTTQYCPMGESICNSAKNKLETAFEGYIANVELVFDPPWTFESLSEEGRRFLGRI
ncbi:MAG: metal-sulfur cluster assembly factor [Bacteroidetes bacterium]|nr:metal-sulfur cluster assembly factor [Bacteroidota bacterium]